MGVKEELLEKGIEGNWKDALKLLNNFSEDSNEYFLVYKRANQTSEHEFKFNRVNKIDNETFVVAFHNEATDDGIRYYSGEDMKLNQAEIVGVKVIDPSKYDFVVYTD
ncbi:hypothetical protein [Aquibacillus kalidii]|uniref:hypothetical protein n=1 Tax=Aquibacillus kalidii TaxID=2762597 RepID=UPI0016467437|nr:hypothetical protein [Aquibacillus kalidii]